MTTTAATVSYYAATYHGHPDQVRRARAAVAGHLAGCPVADDAILIVSELSSNAIVHSDSKDEFFTVRVEACPDHVRVEVEDLGGPWQDSQPDDRPHGLDIISALTGPGNWGVQTTSSGGRIIWARLDLPPAKTRHVNHSPREDSPSRPDAGPAPEQPTDMTPADELTSRVFRALYQQYDLRTLGILHIVTPRGTPVFIGDSLGQIARQLSEHEHQDQGIPGSRSGQALHEQGSLPVPFPHRRPAPGTPAPAPTS